jgi:benzil reductase ((S)-benzoin forming)
MTANSPSSLALVTGTSSGIGEALALDLLGRGWRVVGVARRDAGIRDSRYTHLRVDIGDLAALSALLESTVRPLLADPAVTRVGLVNNAALVALLGTVQTIDPLVLPTVYAVNTAAPILLMGWFLRSVRPVVPLRIVNVSSGLAVFPLPGAVAYGNTKAALRMAGMVVAAELDAESGARPRDVSVLSYEPGLVDTPMQTTARNTPRETLPVVQMFTDWAATGALVAPALPAREIADYLSSDGHPRWLEQRYPAVPAA